MHTSKGDNKSAFHQIHNVVQEMLKEEDPKISPHHFSMPSLPKGWQSVDVSA